MHSIGKPSGGEAMTVDVRQLLFRPSPEVQARRPTAARGLEIRRRNSFPLRLHLWLSSALGTLIASRSSDQCGPAISRLSEAFFLLSLTTVGTCG